MHDMPTDLLPTADAAEAIGVKPSTLSRWVASGRIAYVHKLPGKTGPFLFTRREVERVRKDYAASLAPASETGAES